MSDAPKEVLDSMEDLLRCQFCGKKSYAFEWENDRCPACKRQYDALLAQEEESD